MPAACVLIIRDGLILSVSRKDDHTDFGLPGGKIDPGESSEDAAARELYEETGLSVTDLRAVFTLDDNGDPCTTFIGNVSGQIKTLESGVVAWCRPETLIAGTFGAYNLALFKHLGVV